LLGLGILIFSLFVFGGIIWAGQADSATIKCYLDEKKVASEIEVTAKNNFKYVNLSFLSKYLGMVNDWDPDHGEVFLRFGKLSIKIYENKTEYTQNGKSLQLGHAPFSKDNQLWIPVDFLQKFGLKVKREDETTLYLEWEHDYLLGMENINYEGHPALLLYSTKKLKYHSSLKKDPLQLVIELDRLKLHEMLSENLSYKHSLVKKFSYRKTTDDQVQLVLELTKSTGYQIIYDPNEENQLIIVLNYLVESVAFVQKDEERKVYLCTSDLPQYEANRFDSPNRYVVDFYGATLATETETMPGDNLWIKRIRMSQYKANIVRVVFDLLGKDPCFIMSNRNNACQLEVRTFQKINQLNWKEAEQVGELTIDASGELIESINKFKAPNKLQIDLKYAKLAGGVSLPSINSSQVFGNKITALKDTVRIELNLNNYIDYLAKFSPDRRQMKISFRRSPLVGKTIVVDAGHGGIDAGACGRQGTREKDVNLEVSMKLKELLEEYGAYVVLTREDDRFISLYERSFLANYLAADLFISIHTNNHPNLNVKGIELYYYAKRASGKKLAQNVIENMVEYTGLNNLKARVANFVVIREAQMPSILIELGYLSNYQEEQIIRTREFREKAARGIMQGIIEYYNTPNP